VPCWVSDTCPNPEPEKCDSIMREVITIKRKVGLSVAHNECIDLTSSKAHSDVQMRFWCVKRGLVGDVTDGKLAEGAREHFVNYFKLNPIEGEPWP
jgi:hypothetical protein